MQIAVICEYNPFHDGHAYMLRQIRARFGDDATITAVMGGIFSQRGAPYIAPPYIRAASALAGGCDLVVELPFPFSASRAADFARAGVEIAARLGADILAFGSECGDLEMLEKRRARLDGEELRALAASLSAADPSLGTTRASAKAYETLYGKADLAAPNDILAIEYLRALAKCENAPAPAVIRRVGDYKGGGEGYASASALRRAYAENGLAAFRGQMPDSALAPLEAAESAGLLGADENRLASAVLMKLSALRRTPDAFNALGGERAALERLCAVADRVRTLDGLFAAAASKRCTDASLRRAALYALTDTTEDMLAAAPAYTRLLTANARGRAVLTRAPRGFVLTKPADAEKLSDGGAQFAATFAAERAFALCLDGDYDFMRQTPLITED